MQTTMKVMAGAALALALGFGASSAQATVYNFDVNYLGGGVAVLAPGSDNMLAASPTTGDVINYSITATGGYWTTLAANGPNIFGALGDLQGNFGLVGFNYTYSFNLGAVQQWTGSGSGLQGGADLGPRQNDYPAGISFDNFFETLTLTSTAQATSFTSILPSWPGQSPEGGAPDFISYTAGRAVPEPAAWALMLLGFGGMGAVLRQRRRAAFAA